MPKNHLRDLEEFLKVLSPRIQADLHKWYGENAKLSREPTFQSRDWSFFFRYFVQVSESENYVVLVKIRHLQNMSIADAILDPEMKEESKNEFWSLRKLRKIFADFNNGSFFTIRDLAWYEDLNAVVMEEAEIRTLKSFYQDPALWFFQNAQKKFKGNLWLTGRWLHIFHTNIGSVQNGSVFSEILYKNALMNLGKIESFTQLSDLAITKELLHDLYKIYSKRNMPYGVIHDNFSTSNVFVTEDGEICSFDPHNKVGPLSLDLAKFITDMETNRIQVITNGLVLPAPRMKEYIDSFLKGYFLGKSHGDYYLSLYRLISLIQKWEENENTYSNITGNNKLIYYFGLKRMRKYFSKLLIEQNKQVQKLLFV